MASRVVITLLYGAALGTVGALGNYDLTPAYLPLTLWVAGLAIGFLVGDWRVLLSLVLLVAGQSIGWGRDLYDVNPVPWWFALMPLHVLVSALPLAVGVGVRRLWENRGGQRPDPDPAQAGPY